MYTVKKSRAGYIFDLPRERIAFLFKDGGAYIMYHDERVLCYSFEPQPVTIEEVENFERTSELPALIREIKSGRFPESCVVKELPPVDEDLMPFNPDRKCVVAFTGFQDTVIDYMGCGGETFAVARLVDDPSKACRFVGKGNYKIAAVNLGKGKNCLGREDFVSKLRECTESF